MGVGLPFSLFAKEKIFFPKYRGGGGFANPLHIKTKKGLRLPSPKIIFWASPTLSETCSKKQMLKWAEKQAPKNLKKSCFSALFCSVN